MLKKVISCALSPNTEADDVWEAIKVLLTPWKWKHGEGIEVIESWFKDYFKVQTVALLNSGRSAFLALLEAFGIGKGDEVLVQAFTCVAVPNSVLWAGAKPVFVDIDDSFNLDPVDAEKKITGKTKAIVVQHTFGIPAQVDRLSSFAKKYKLVLIEDCAHSLGAMIKGKKVGTFGDAAFFSFGRDKVVSSVWGGVALINDKCRMINAKWKLKQIQKSLPLPSSFWIFQQLLHPIAFSIIQRLYDVIIGKILLVLLQKLRLLSLPVYKEEKVGSKPKDFPAKYPNALATLLVNQLKKLDRYSQQRQEVVRLYGGKGALLRYPVRVENPKKIIEQAKKRGILLGNWYHNIIDPAGVVFEKIDYVRGSCLKAEDAAAHIINLPTRITLGEAQRVMDLI